MKYILAEIYKGQFRPVELGETLNEILGNLEYGDVKENVFQIWEYPNGQIFTLRSSGNLSSKDYYALYTSGLWQAELILLTQDSEKVRNAYELLIRPRLSLLQRFKRWLERY